MAVDKAGRMLQSDKFCALITDDRQCAGSDFAGARAANPETLLLFVMTERWSMIRQNVNFKRTRTKSWCFFTVHRTRYVFAISFYSGSRASPLNCGNREYVVKKTSLSLTNLLTVDIQLFNYVHLSAIDHFILLESLLMPYTVVIIS